MRTSLNDIRDCERYLSGEMNPEESLVFQARELTDPILKLNMRVHRHLRMLVKFYHRKKVKAEAEAVHRRIFNDPSKKDFQQAIFRLFKS